MKTVISNNIDKIYGRGEEIIYKIGKIIYQKYLKRKELEESDDSDDGLSHPRAPEERINSSLIVSTVQYNSTEWIV